MKQFVAILVFIMASWQLQGQLESVENLEESTKKGFYKSHVKGFFSDLKDFGTPFSLNGNVDLTMKSYTSSDSILREDPFAYTLSTNLNIKIYKIDMPFSLTVTAKNTEASYPKLNELVDAFKNQIRDKSQIDKFQKINQSFVRFGTSPRYKWAKLHLGHRSMGFSDYTMNNINFNGVGTELTPGKLRLSGMYGQLAKAEPVNLSLINPNFPVYQRLGWAAKVGYGDEQTYADLIVFKARDVPNSIFIPEDYSNQPSAEENLVLGIKASKLFLEKIRLKVEYANSAVSPNALDATTNESRVTSFLFKQRSTTRNYSAMDLSLRYEGKAMNSGFIVKRIDPGYSSFGTYYFGLDNLQFVGDLHFGVWENKLNFDLESGLQTSNNLDLSKTATSQTYIYKLGAHLNHGNLSGNVDLSNNSQKIGYVLNQRLDSLNAVIITNNAGGDLTYTLPSEGGTKHTFSLSGNIQDINDDIVNLQESGKSKVVNGSFIYNIIFGKQWNIAARATYAETFNTFMMTKRYVPGLTVGKSLLEDKIRFLWTNDYYINTSPEMGNSNNLVSTLNLDFEISSKLRPSIIWTYKRNPADGFNPVKESTILMNFNYNFNFEPPAKNSGQQ